VKPKITFKCRNEDCEEYDKLYDIYEVRIFVLRDAVNKFN
jgi:hypothetical protein